MVTKALIKESFFISNLNGLHPGKNSYFTKLNILSSIILTAAFGVECLLELLQGWKGLISLDSIVAVIAMYQVLSKLSIVAIYRNKLNEIVDCIHKYYWPLDKCGKKLELEFQYIISSIRKIMIVTITLTTITVSTYVIAPLLYTERKMPIPTFHPTDLTKSPNYELAYIIQVVIIFKVMPPSVLAFDLSFISIITYIVFELRMISIEIKTLEIDSTTNDNDTGILERLKLIGAYLTFESGNVANAAFRSKWWVKTQPRLRRSIALIIQRSQKPETLTAGGMIKLNLETFSN
ncbi:hypothetical protein ILUMI_18066, partial [Ignelater luminosus]